MLGTARDRKRNRWLCKAAGTTKSWVLSSFQIPRLSACGKTRCRATLRLTLINFPYKPNRSDKMVKPSCKKPFCFLHIACLALTAGLFLQGIAIAAPLDELLAIQPEQRPLHGEVEVAWDGMNKMIDLFGVRGDQYAASGTNVGDYAGYHLRGGLALDKHLWSFGSYWKRAAKTPYDDGDDRTYQAGLQLQVTKNKDMLPAISLRISGWGNSTGEVIKGSKTPMGGGRFAMDADSIVIKKPQDKQFQGDIIGTWAVTPATSISLFSSMGISEVKFSDLYAAISGCNYKVDRIMMPNEFTGGLNTGISLKATNAAGDPNCSMPEFSAPMELFGRPDMPTGMYIGYDASYYQFGGNAQWFNNDWLLKLGYRFQKWDRSELDDAVAKFQHADKTVYDTNNHITGEVNYKLLPNVAAFVRSQYMTNQFLGEIPYSYNLYSSHKFDASYGIMTFGITAGF